MPLNHKNVKFKYDFKNWPEYVFIMTIKLSLSTYMRVFFFNVTYLNVVLTSFSNLSISSSYSCFSFFFLSSAFFARNCLYLVCILRAASSFSVHTFAFGFAGSAGLPLPAAGAAPFLAP